MGGRAGATEEAPGGQEAGCMHPRPAGLRGPGLQGGRSPERPRGSRAACSGHGPARDREAGDSQRPDAHAVRRPAPAPSFCKEKGWLEPSEEEVAAASDKRCFLFPAWESVSDKRKRKQCALGGLGESYAAAEAAGS